MIFRAPLVPNIHIFAFLYFSLLNLSIKIQELLYMLVPIKIPFSSHILEDIKGYVEISELPKIFLLAIAFISSLFSINGKQEIKHCSCLKSAFLVIIPRRLK